MHRSARGGGDVTELGQHALSALKVELSLLCFDKALVQVGDLIFFFAIATFADNNNNNNKFYFLK